jgi:hypothetical protein
MQTLHHLWGVFVTFLLLILTYSVNSLVRVQETSLLSRDVFYSNYSAKLVDYVASSNIPVKFSDVQRSLKTIDSNLPKYFPNKEFTLEDLIAIALFESHFVASQVGRHGEKGIFQILDWPSAARGINKPNANPFDPASNTEAGLFVLKQKFDQHKNVKLSIIAYNGYRVDGDGKVVEDYWKQFQIYKSRVMQMRKEI